MIQVASGGGRYLVELTGEHLAAVTVAGNAPAEGDVVELSAELVGELVRLAASDPTELPQDDARSLLGSRT